MLRNIAIGLLMLASTTAFAATPVFKDGLTHYLKGEVSQAIQIWKQLGDQGDLQSQKQLGQYYLTDRDHRDYEQSVYWYRKAAQQSDKEATGYLDNAEAQLTTWKALSTEIGSKEAYTTLAFREHLSEGEDTHCGFVVDVRSKVVLIQTASQPHWFKKDDLYLPASKHCDISDN